MSQQPYQYQQPLAPPTNALALASVVLGILAGVIALVSGTVLQALLFAGLPALLAIIFGFIGVTTANRLGGRRKTLAIWGIILGFAIVPIHLIGGFLGAAIFGITR